MLLTVAVKPLKKLSSPTLERSVFHAVTIHLYRDVRVDDPEALADESL